MRWKRRILKRGESTAFAELSARGPGVAIEIDLDSLDGLTLLRDPSPAEPMLRDLWTRTAFGTVAGLIPAQFDSLARIDEPNRDREARDAFDPTLSRVLARHTSRPGEVFFCVWEGYAPMHVVPAGVRMIDRPGRRYLVFHGAIDAWGALLPHPMGLMPDLVWPADHAWFVGSDTDIDDWAFIGASERCLADLETQAAIRVTRVAPSAPLAPPGWRG